MRKPSRMCGCFVLVVAGLGCSSDPAPGPAGGRNFGTLTPQGPRVSGSRVGMVNVNGQMGVGYDVSGDGRPDEVDLDGDGVSDGEDINGDGVITVWRNLRTGATPPARPERLILATDPDLIERLDPNADPDNEMMGMVNEPPALMPPPGGLLRAISQGGQGSCTSFAVAATATLVRHKREAAAMPGLDANTLWASPPWLYTRLIALHNTMCNQGTNIGFGLDLLVLHGAATLAEQPYRSGDMPELCEPINPDVSRAPHLYRIGSHTFIPNGPTFRAQVQESLAAGLPVAFGVNLPVGFQDYRVTAAGADVTQTYRGMGRCMDSTHCGGHAMVFVGYDNARSAYRVQNSWGEDWGDRGYVWWDYASLESLQDLYAEVLVPLPDAPAPLPAPDAMGLAMAQPMGSQPVLVRRMVNGQMTWQLIVRVQFNQPVNVTELVATVNETPFAFGVESAIAYGDLTFLVGETPPAAGVMVPLVVRGTLRGTGDLPQRGGMAFERTMTVTAPAPTM